MAAKTSTRHPYAAIEHRVIDSPAYAALTYSARSLLTLLTRQLTKDNNGHLQATFKYMRKHGIDSEHTLSRGIKELISHGFVYRTRVGGYQQGASQYAVTWLSITKRNDIFLDGFVPCAWRNWQATVMPNDKSPPSIMQSINCKNGILAPVAHAKNAVGRGAKSADNEYVPSRVYVAASKSALSEQSADGKEDDDTGDPTTGIQRTRDDDRPTDAWSQDTGEFNAVSSGRSKQTQLYDRRSA
ncbi:MAG: hypothetical protein IPN98_00020 [Propionivibrio sp.]|nr:hypothetical protein [Propionivibrio sp.]